MWDTFSERRLFSLPRLPNLLRSEECPRFDDVKKQFRVGHGNGSWERLQSRLKAGTRSIPDFLSGGLDGCENLYSLRVAVSTLQGQRPENPLSSKSIESK